MQILCPIDLKGIDMKQQVLLIVNPMAGRQRIHGELIHVVDTLTKAGYETLIYTTQNAQATKELLKENDSRFDKVLCCGGDGTFNEVLGGTMLWKKQPVLGYIPAGTTNDFAHGLGLPSDIKAAAELFVKGTPHTYDAGLFNETFFSYIASFGVFTEASYATPQFIKNQMGHAAYILEGIRELTNLTAYHVRVEAGDKIYEDDYLFGAVSNAKSMGGIIKMDDDLVDLSDGLLEVMLIRMPKTLMDLSAIMTALNTLKFDNENFVFFHADKITVHSEEELVWSLDGERMNGGTESRINCIHQAFSIINAG